ncbi:segregation/condensation protein A [Patescibacteria group bacterium]|nr:segregation/condensation protein A [Patescibacteria group bacterium]
MNQYKVRIEQFEGPLDLLLQLIEQEELDITKVSLAKMADDYIAHVSVSPKIRPEELADFLVVAAKLILIKSKQLLPNLEVQEEGIDLETQLKMYREFVQASQKLNKMIKQKNWTYGRERLALGTAQGFFPPKELKKETLQEIFFKIVKKLEPFIALPKETLRKTISISEKIEHIKSIILEQVKACFSQVVGKAKDKTEVIVSFLALLELVKQRVVEVSQDELFEDITIQKLKV